MWARLILLIVGLIVGYGIGVATTAAPDTTSPWHCLDNQP